MSDPQITHQGDDTKGRYVLRRDGHEAELTYSKVGKTQVIADHTAVADPLRGTGAGLRLVEQMVTDARSGDYKIVPLCPFVNEMRRRHPAWADAFTGTA